MTQAAPAVDVRGADKTYPNGTHALQPVDLRIEEGEFVTLLGPSGCGKSTLLKMIAGLLEGDAGEILLWGEPTGIGAQLPKKLAFVFQAPTLMPWADVQTNVRLPLDLDGRPRRDSDARVMDALALVGLERFARALVTEPQLLLMDEPFGALDEITRHKLDGELLDLWQKKGLTVVFVTHSIHEAVFLSTRVVMMAARPGRIVDELRIGEPYPRSPDFMVSTDFSRHAKHLQDSLRSASMATAVR